jgi:hypothetical protein
MDAAEVLTAIRSGPFGMAHTQEEAPERDDFSSNRHPALSFCWRMISGQTPRVCPEGKPEPTPHQVRGRLFPDHALVQPPIDLTFNIELRPVGDDDDAGGGWTCEPPLLPPLRARLKPVLRG